MTLPVTTLKLDPELHRLLKAKAAHQGIGLRKLTEAALWPLVKPARKGAPAK